MKRFYLLFVLLLIVSLILSAIPVKATPITDTPSPASGNATTGTVVANFVGSWVNEDSATNSITRVEIRLDANTIIIQMWGRCHPTDCYWGEMTANVDPAIAIPYLSIRWDPGFAIIDQRLEVLADGRLKVYTHTHFTDNSGRPDYDSTDFFVKVKSVPSNVLCGYVPDGPWLTECSTNHDYRFADSVEPPTMNNYVKLYNVTLSGDFITGYDRYEIISSCSECGITPPPPPPPAALLVDVWTDRGGQGKNVADGTYKIGESMMIYFSLNKDCTRKVTINKPDGTQVVFGPQDVLAGTRRFSAAVESPAGQSTIIFEAWAGSESGRDICTFNVIPKEPTKYTLTTRVEPSGSGSASLSSGSYDAGAQVTITAYANQGWEFDHWAGDASGTNPTITLTMNSNKSVIAYFIEEKVIQYTLTIYVKDWESEKPIAGAIIYLDGVRKGETNGDGKFAAPIESPGTYHVKITKAGWNDTWDKVSISSDTTITLYMNPETRPNLRLSIRAEPKSVYISEIVEVTVLIENAGRSTARHIQTNVELPVALELLQAEGYGLRTNTWEGELGKGRTGSYSFYINPVRPGVYLLKAVATYENDVEGEYSAESEAITVEVIVKRVPVPSFSIKKPDLLLIGQIATIEVMVNNNGAASPEAYTSISLSNDIKIIDHSAGGKVYPKGSDIWHKGENKPRKSESTLLEWCERFESLGEKTYQIRIKVNPGFWIFFQPSRNQWLQTRLAFKREGTKDVFIRYPEEGLIDQQGWPAETTTLPVVYLDELKDVAEKRAEQYYKWGTQVNAIINNGGTRQLPGGGILDPLENLLKIFGAQQGNIMLTALGDLLGGLRFGLDCGSAIERMVGSLIAGTRTLILDYDPAKPVYNDLRNLNKHCIDEMSGWKDGDLYNVSFNLEQQQISLEALLQDVGNWEKLAGTWELPLDKTLKGEDNLFATLRRIAEADKKYVKALHDLLSHYEKVQVIK